MEGLTVEKNAAFSNFSGIFTYSVVEIRLLVTSKGSYVISRHNHMIVEQTLSTRFINRIQFSNDVDKMPEK